MRVENKNETTVLLREHLKGCVFDLFYDAFAKDGQLIEEGRDYENIRQALVEKFGRNNRPEDEVRRALEAKLD